MPNVSYQTILKYYDEAKRLNYPAKLTVTNSSARLESAHRGVVTATAINIKFGSEMGFVNKVLKAGERAADNPPPQLLAYTGGADVRPRDISYFRHRLPNVPRVKYSHVTEVDLTSAYFYAAAQLGIITQAIFDEAKAQPKGVRLVALGALAASKTIFINDPQTGETIYEKYDGRTASLFFSAAKLVDDVLQDAADKYPVLFYWVDAVFVRKEHGLPLKAFFESKGFPSKEKPLDKILIQAEPGKPTFVKCVEATGNTKFFTFPARR